MPNLKHQTSYNTKEEEIQYPMAIEWSATSRCLQFAATKDKDAQQSESRRCPSLPGL